MTIETKNQNDGISIKTLLDTFLKRLSEIDTTNLSIDELYRYANILKTVSEINTIDPLLTTKFLDDQKSYMTPKYPCTF